MSSPSTKMSKKRTIDSSRGVKTKALKKGQSDVNEKSEKSRQATNRTGKSEKSKEVTTRTGKTVAKSTTGNTNAGKTVTKNVQAAKVKKIVANVEPKKYDYGLLQPFRNMIFQELKDIKKAPSTSEQFATKKEFENFVKLVRQAFSYNDKTITRKYKQLFETDINKNSAISGGSTSNKTTSAKKENVSNVETSKSVEKKIELGAKKTESTGQRKNSKTKSPEKVNSDDDDSDSNMSDSDGDEEMTNYEDSDQENEGDGCNNMQE